jgi:hypothetical protein
MEIPGEALGVVQTANFMREAPLLEGTYLLGYYRWPVRWKVISAPDGEHTAWQANLSMAVQGVG